MRSKVVYVGMGDEDEGHRGYQGTWGGWSGPVVVGVKIGNRV